MIFESKKQVKFYKENNFRKKMVEQTIENNQNRIFNRHEDILFVPDLESCQDRRFAIGVLSIAGYLREKGYNSKIIEMHKLLNWNHKYAYFNKKEKARLKKLLFDSIIKANPKILCFSPVTRKFNESMDLMEELKPLTNAKIIVGGYHANILPLDFFKYKKDIVDFVVYGEGELSMHELIDAIDKGDDFSKIDGVVWKNNEGEIIKNSPRAMIADLDILPMPAYDMIDLNFYLSMWDGNVRGIPLRSLAMITSRGCPFSCTFCTCNQVFGRKIRMRSPAKVEEEIKFLKEKYDIEGVWYCDDALTNNLGHFKEICHIMKKYNLVWGCQGRIDAVSHDVAKAMSAAGGVQMDFGVESGSDRILKDVIKKGFRVEAVKKAFDILKQYNVRYLANFMVGFPTETREEFEMTKKLAFDIDADFYATFITVPELGTELYKRMELNVEPKDYWKLERSNWHFTSDPSIFNQSEIKNLEEEYTNFTNQLIKKIIWKGLKHIPFYIGLWLKLPKKTQRMGYMVKKIYKIFIFDRLSSRIMKI